MQSYFDQSVFRAYLKRIAYSFGVTVTGTNPATLNNPHINVDALKVELMQLLRQKRLGNVGRTGRFINIAHKMGLLLSSDNTKPTFAKTGLVQEVAASHYGAIPTTGIDFTTAEIFYFNIANRSRIRQSGSLVKIQFYLGVKPDTRMHFSVWRRISGTYYLIGIRDILPLVSAGGINTIYLDTPIDVKEGDYTAISHSNSTGAANFYKGAASGNGGGKYFTVDAITSPTDFGNQGNAISYYLPIICYIDTAPVIVSIGDSIISGSPVTQSFIEDSYQADTFGQSIGFKLQALLGVTGQNMGIGGNYISQVLARFDADVLAAHPKYVLIEGGVNDVYNGVSAATAMVSWTAVLQKCKDNNIIPIVLLITPWTGGTTLQNTTIDTINTQLIALVPNYKGIVVDARQEVGMFRSGGPAGNLWDIQVAYNADNIHFNSLGYQIIANTIRDTLAGVFNGIIDTTKKWANLVFDVHVINDFVQSYDNIITAGVNTSGFSAMGVAAIEVPGNAMLRQQRFAGDAQYSILGFSNTFEIDPISSFIATSYLHANGDIYAYYGPDNANTLIGNIPIGGWSGVRRNGNTFTAETSPDGINWTIIYIFYAAYPTEILFVKEALLNSASKTYYPQILI